MRVTKSAWAWGWSSSGSAAIAGLVAAALLVAAPASAVVFLSRNEALALAFSGADRIERLSFVLTDEQAERIEQRARAPLDSRLQTLHAGYNGDRLLGYALIDVHTVRTLPEALMVVIDPDGRLRSVRMLAFHEPGEFMPTDRWFAQFTGRELDASLQLHGRVHAIAGATLSARAVTRSVRRALAIHEVLVAPPALAQADAE